ncbi:hypothetical protein WA026_013482 [Henosepilachna vigintioctopunctata]|uniref:GAF domain-containing protein n=1 Tax=Henosepilachna vigintioctopunctata TaxID=420089 RepID=A0AAW1VC10_9CUCU
MIEVTCKSTELHEIIEKWSPDDVVVKFLQSYQIFVVLFSFKLFVYKMTEIEPLGQVCRKRKERIESMVEQPPYCQKEFPCLPIIDDCLPVPLRLEVSDATRLMYFMENFNGVTSKEQEYDINTYLKKTCEASDVFIIHIIRSSDQGRVQMLSDRVLEDEIVMPLSKRTLNAIVQFDGQNYFCANDLHPDVKRICTAVMDREGDPMNVIPIISRCRRNKDESLKIHGNPVALVCLLNCEKDDYFVLRATQELFRYCSTTLLNTMEGEQEKKLKHNSHLLLEATKSLFMNIHDLDLLLRDIMIKAKDLTDAERCSLFLMDPEHLHWVSRVFNADPADGVMEVRITLDQAIAAHVAATGRVMNIRDAYQHPLFHKDDEAGGVKTRNILCFPIEMRRR